MELAVRLLPGVRTRCNAAFSLLVGGLQGVRGLEDALYRNWIQVIGNLELRHAVMLAARWALQGVAFVDAAAFERITPIGAAGAPCSAVSVGLGIRLVPTWLASVVPRIDVARLIGAPGV